VSSFLTAHSISSETDIEINTRRQTLADTLSFSFSASRRFSASDPTCSSDETCSRLWRTGKITWPIDTW